MLDGAAVKASIERFVAMSTGPYKAVAAQITSMEVTGTNTVVFTLNGPWAGFPFTLANTPGMIVNTKVADAAGDTFGANPTGAGVGAFEFVSIAANENIVLAGKDEWWGGPVCLDTLTFVPIPADPARYETFETGGFDAAYLHETRRLSPRATPTASPASRPSPTPTTWCCSTPASAPHRPTIRRSAWPWPT